MPEWVEYVFFSWFLNVFGAFVGPVDSFEQRLNRDEQPANKRDDPLRSERAAALELMDARKGRACYVTWSPHGKLLVGRVSTADGELLGFLTICAGIQGYPQLVVRKEEVHSIALADRRA